MAFLLNLGEVILLVGFLPSVIGGALSQEALPPECAPEQVRHCYRDYSSHLWRRSVGNDTEGSIPNEVLVRWCSEITEKIHCHQRVALCPEEVRRNFRSQERGYEALRDLFCDKDAIRDYYTARSCQDPEKFFPCHNVYMGDVTPENSTFFYCKLSQAATECYETAFSPRCGMTLSMAEAAYFRGEDALKLLGDCNRSTRLYAASDQLLLAAVATLALLRWTGASWQLNLRTQ
ncbi:uncharacterized protein LOC144106562 [Amblyomma americanum]